VILFLHRDYQKEETACHVAKNREGRLGTVHLLFRPEFVAFDQALRQEAD
jgi:replicative DNA helicase